MKTHPLIVNNIFNHAQFHCKKIYCFFVIIFFFFFFFFKSKANDGLVNGM